MGSTKRQIEQWVAQAEAAGWRVKREGQHFRLYPADPTQPPMTCARTPSDHHALANIKGDFRRRGLHVK